MSKQPSLLKRNKNHWQKQVARARALGEYRLVWVRVCITNCIFMQTCFAYNCQSSMRQIESLDMLQLYRWIDVLQIAVACINSEMHGWEPKVSMHQAQILGLEASC